MIFTVIALILLLGLVMFWGYFLMKWSWEFKHKTISHNDIFIKTPDIAQEDTTTKEITKRVHKVFDENQELILMRSMKRHSASCPNPATCTKINCWTPTRDSIVGETVVSVKSSRDKLREEREAREKRHAASMARLKYGLLKTEEDEKK